MKITAGFAQGMKLSTRKGDRTRPTTDKVRQSVFNVLAPIVNDSTFLDLYAGSGAMGLEALSRGASKALFVESDRTALTSLKINLTELQRRFKAQDIEEPAALTTNTIVGKWLSEISRSSSKPDSFDIIWGDPPYEHSLEELLKHEENLRLIAQQGTKLAWELPGLSNIEIPTLKSWKIQQVKSYGQTSVAYFVTKEMTS